MRTSRLALAFGVPRLAVRPAALHVAVPALAAFLALAAVARPSEAQVTDAERASARELFKEGDQLQRAGHFAEALDKFQRAQQVFAAPTNVLRIAECDAALGKLVESAEAYREVLRTQLPANAPPAFQAAVDQAKAELSQVEPRVPRLVVQVQPAGVQGPQMQIDGQNVPAALIGEAMPLDAGVHKLAIIAPGYASSEQQVELRERETKTVAVTLNAIPGVTYEPAGGAAYAAGATATTATPPPPPPMVAPDAANVPQPRRSNLGFILGLHLGGEVAGGQVPVPTGGVVDASSVSNTGFAYGLDGAFRFGRRWFVGLTFDRATLGHGNENDFTGVSDARSSTTLLGLTLAVVTNPDRVSFYGQIGLAERWLDVRETLTSGPPSSKLYSGGEFTLAAGVWIPIGDRVRLLPKFDLGLGTLSNGSFTAGANGITTDGSQTAFSFFGMFGVAGYYNIDL
jgi:hypothetical protein